MEREEKNLLYSKSHDLKNAWRGITPKPWRKLFILKEWDLRKLNLVLCVEIILVCLFTAWCREQRAHLSLWKVKIKRRRCQLIISIKMHELNLLLLHTGQASTCATLNECVWRIRAVCLVWLLRCLCSRPTQDAWASNRGGAGRRRGGSRWSWPRGHLLWGVFKAFSVWGYVA